MRVKAAGYGRRVRNRGPLRHMLNKRCVLVMVWEMRRGIYTSEKRFSEKYYVEWFFCAVPKNICHRERGRDRGSVFRSKEGSLCGRGSE